jgi:H+/Cl- antiporter ClcA
MQKMKKIFLIIFFILVLTISFSYAQRGPTPPEIPQDPNAPIKRMQDIIYLFGNILRYIALIFWLGAFAGAFYAGYLFLLSGGNEEKIGKAKKMLWYVVIAIAIGLMAYGLPTLVYNFLNPQGQQQNQPLRPAPGPSLIET